MFQIFDRMQTVFRDVLDDDGIVLRPEMTAEDVETRDSLSHINLITGIEEEFRVKFTTADELAGTLVAQQLLQRSSVIHH